MVLSRLPISEELIIARCLLGCLVGEHLINIAGVLWAGYVWLERCLQLFKHELLPIYLCEPGMALDVICIILG